LENDKIVYKEIEYIPGLVKIINEIIDNSVDEAIKTNFKFANDITVVVTDKKVTIEDNGRGIPVKQNENGEYLPSLCFFNARAGSNFDDDDNKAQIGMNGVGSFASACFSKKFEVVTDDGKNAYKLVGRDGLERKSEKLLPTSGKTGTKVVMFPDLDAFNGITEINDVHINLIKQRLINLAVSYPDINFKFNKKKIKINKAKDYMNYFGSTHEIIEADNFIIGIFPNDSDDFRYMSYVNGLHIKNGGNHIDLVTNNLVTGLRDKLIKKYKSIKPGDIKNRLQLVCFFKGFKNVEFDSQTKERLTNSTKEINDFLGDIDYERAIKRIVKKKEFIDPIVEVYKIKEELKNRKLLKKTQKRGKIRSDNYLPPISKHKRQLVLAEGLSAQAGVSKALGRDGIGYYAMKGVPLNVFAANIQKMSKNKELIDICNILGLDLSSIENNDMDFEYVLIATDADYDGAFITSQLIGMFHRLGVDLIKSGRIKRLRTPIIAFLDKKNQVTDYFFSITEYQEWLKNNTVSKSVKQKYFKGLSSWSGPDLKGIIERDGLETFVETLELDKDAEGYITDWLSEDSADKRKDFLRESPAFDINSV
jgi:DNA topoisomerase-2